jgi:hypothetical protein
MSQWRAARCTAANSTPWSRGHRHPPLEKFIVPIALVGTRGLYRRPQAQCLPTATNDDQVILA